MTHEDAGHYAAKHPQGTQANPEIEHKLELKISDGKISCAAAHGIAEELGVEPTDVGVVIDLMEARIEKCQLGLFGYQPEKSIVKPVDKPAPEVKAAVDNNLENGRISCKNCWSIADRLGEKKMDVSNVCEGMGIRVSVCQIGAF